MFLLSTMDDRKLEDAVMAFSAKYGWMPTRHYGEVAERVGGSAKEKFDELKKKSSVVSKR